MTPLFLAHHGAAIHVDPRGTVDLYAIAITTSTRAPAATRRPPPHSDSVRTHR